MTGPQRAEERFETRAIHAGHEPDPANGAVMPPVYLTSTYKQDAPAFESDAIWDAKARKVVSELVAMLGEARGGKGSGVNPG